MTARGSGPVCWCRAPPDLRPGSRPQRSSRIRPRSGRTLRSVPITGS